MRRKADERLETVRKEFGEKGKRLLHRHLKGVSLRTFRKGWQFPEGLNIMTGQ